MKRIVKILLSIFLLVTFCVFTHDFAEAKTTKSKRYKGRVYHTSKAKKKKQYKPLLDTSRRKQKQILIPQDR